MVFIEWEDYVVLVITLALTLGIGLYFALKGRTQNTSHYLLGDGKMAIVPVALSTLVTYVSGITMLGIPTEVYMYGMQWYLTAVGWFIGNIFCSYVFIPALKRLDAISIFEYLQRRYNAPGVRMFVAVLAICQALNYLGIVLFIPAVSLKVVTNIPEWLSIVGIMAFVVIYTMIGGFKAVIWSDAVQAVLILGGVLAVIVKGTSEAGGVASVITAIVDKGRANFFVFDPDPTLRHSFWSLLFGSVVFIISMVFQQVIFQRIKATPTIKSAQRMYVISAFTSLFIFALVVIEGGVMFAYFHNTGCDLLVSKQVSNPNQLLVEMVTRIFKDTPCLPGLFLSAIFSASLSTVSSLLNVLAAMFWEDVVKRCSKPMSERKSTIITKMSVLAFGIVGILSAFAVSKFQGPIYQIFETTNSCFTCGVTGIFVLGWIDPLANKMGAIVGGLVSVCVIGWISVGKMTSSGLRINPPLESASTEGCPFLNSLPTINITNGDLLSNTTLGYSQEGPEGVDLLYSISYKWLSTVGILITLITGSAVSRLQGSVPTDSDLVIPICDILCCYIPESIRAKFRCGVQYSRTNEDKTINAVENVTLMERTDTKNIFQTE